MNKIFFSGLLRPQSSNRLLRNFRGFLSLEKKPETLQQELYHCILAKPSTDPQKCFTLVRKVVLPFFKAEKADPDLLTYLLLASGVPVKDIKTFKAQLNAITTSDWGGAVIQELETYADYSPVIQEIIKRGKLIEFRYLISLNLNFLLIFQNTTRVQNKNVE